MTWVKHKRLSGQLLRVCATRACVCTPSFRSKGLCLSVWLLRILGVLPGPLVWGASLISNEWDWFLNCINILSHRNKRRLFNQIDPPKPEIENMNKGEPWSQYSHWRATTCHLVLCSRLMSLKSLLKMVFNPQSPRVVLRASVSTSWFPHGYSDLAQAQEAASEEGLRIGCWTPWQRPCLPRDITVAESLPTWQARENES